MLLPENTLLHKKFVKANKRIAIRSAKQKGMLLQHWVADKLANIFNIDWKQKDDQSLIAVRPGGQHGCDIILRGELYKAFPFDIECKSSEGFNLVSTIQQAEANKKPDNDYLIVHKKKALSEPVVILAWSAFEKLFSKRCKCAEKRNKTIDTGTI